MVPKLDRVKMSRVKRGVKVRFRLSEGGKVTVKATRGRSVVTRTVEVAKGRAPSRVRGLKAGRYRVQVSATDLAGNAAKSRAARASPSAANCSASLARSRGWVASTASWSTG